MLPIELQTDETVRQSLRCVEYRLPRLDVIRPPAVLHALALRYGLVGAATFHHLALRAEEENEPRYMLSFPNWVDAVERHFRRRVAPRLDISLDSNSPARIALLSREPMAVHLALYRGRFPLAICLEAAADAFVRTHGKAFRSAWPWWNPKAGPLAFRASAAESVHFALAFYERRRLGLAEVPEIALLGE